MIILPAYSARNMILYGRIRCGSLQEDSQTAAQPHYIGFNDAGDGRIGIHRTCQTGRNDQPYPVILLTAKTDENDHTEGYLRGADAYITKPFNAKNLELLVQNIQKSRKQSIEHFKQAEELNIKQITNNPRDEVFMKELVELIMANLTKEDFGVTEITTHLRISRSLLHLKLKSLTGCSITQFIRTIKMKEAKTHLLNGMNVSEASFAVGISDPNYFTKCFKKEFNITPTEFLKQLK